MNQAALSGYIRRIILTSPNSAAAAHALEQLEEILLPQLTAGDMTLFSAALSGVGAELSAMQQAVKDAALPEREMTAAAERARRRRMQLDEDDLHDRS